MNHFYDISAKCPFCGDRTPQTIVVHQPTKYNCKECGKRLVIESSVLVKVRAAGRKSQRKMGVPTYNENDFEINFWEEKT
jgi:ribosomal protein S27E|tara:strand:+ start:98 stop:337 length:240 start_codon:yes stop_codon:yes gene_type:complete